MASRRKTKFTTADARAAARTLRITLAPKRTRTKFTAADLARGMTAELEHRDVTRGDPLLSARIALAHLREKSDYYVRLAEMERRPVRPNPHGFDEVFRPVRDDYFVLLWVGPAETYRFDYDAGRGALALSYEGRGPKDDYKFVPLGADDGRVSASDARLRKLGPRGLLVAQAMFESMAARLAPRANPRRAPSLGRVAPDTRLVVARDANGSKLLWITSHKRTKIAYGAVIGGGYKPQHFSGVPVETLYLSKQLPGRRFWTLESTYLALRPDGTILHRPSGEFLVYGVRGVRAQGEIDEQIGAVKTTYVAAPDRSVMGVTLGLTEARRAIDEALAWLLTLAALELPTGVYTGPEIVAHVGADVAALRRIGMPRYLELSEELGAPRANPRRRRR